RYDGAEELRLDPAGDLLVRVGPSQLRQHRPVAYQTIQGVRREIRVRYRLHGRTTVTFELGAYDRAAPLTIDPVLSYSTCLGGTKTDVGWAIAADAAGCAYIAGDALAVFKKLPVSGFQTNFGGGTQFGGDAFIAKIDPTGTNLLYLTYL